MKFRTEMPVPTGFPHLDPERPLLFLGSCFAQNISRELRAMLWDARVNPSGILFNPLSIALALRLAVASADERREAIEGSIVERDGLFYSRLADTSFHGRTAYEICSVMEEAFGKLRRDVAEAQAVAITLGTAFVYRWRASGEVVANCHKLPEKLFSRERISTSEATDAIERAIACIRGINPGAEVILTVSPVRHLRDGFAANTRSKATLILAAGEIADKCAAHYFPAYEILMDDLRDYRFYDRDLAHPSAEAVEYIRDIFLASVLKPSDMSLLREASTLASRAAHRPIDPESDVALRFAEETRRIAAVFARKHPAMLTPFNSLPFQAE